ncbi:SbtR family transcriptional regulator [Mycobacterium stomatepiae]|uniref:SbtR family transcriptional regulator n=1 Tax=Mycobacterium stomatepiae TaxID=470076 RepID=UPI003557180D
MRSDVTLGDVITLVNAIAMATETAGDGEADRMLAIVLTGIAKPQEKSRDTLARHAENASVVGHRLASL